MSLNQHPMLTKAQPSLCHPERSRGICGFTQSASDADQSAALPFVIPERSRGICGFTQSASDADQSAALPFVIPSVAEGSAVSPNQRPMLTKALPSPLSSRA